MQSEYFFYFTKTTLYLRKKMEYTCNLFTISLYFCQLSGFSWLWLTFYMMPICLKYIYVLFATNFQKYQFLGLTVIKRAEVGWRKYYHAYTMDPQLHIFFQGSAAVIVQSNLPDSPKTVQIHYSCGYCRRLYLQEPSNSVGLIMT